jgi:WD40 repeat protein
MLRLDDDDLELEMEPEPERPASDGALHALPGTKQSVVRWLPGETDGHPIVVAGSWDEGVCNLMLWQVGFEAMEQGDAMEQDGVVEQNEGMDPVHSLGVGAEHKGDVLGLAVTGGVDQPYRLYTASGAGGVHCFTVGDITGNSPLTLQWSLEELSPLATLGVSYADETGKVCAVGDDGMLSWIDGLTGKVTQSVQTGEPALCGVCWVRKDGTPLAATVGSRLSLWDERGKSARPVVEMLPNAETPQHLAAQLQCLAADATVRAQPMPYLRSTELSRPLPTLSSSPDTPTQRPPHSCQPPSHVQVPHQICVGSSEGSVFLWDVRQPKKPPLTKQIHDSDVWGVQLTSDELTGVRGALTCSSDGTLQYFQLGGGDTDPSGEVKAKLVALELPINDLHYWVDHKASLGYLVCASDEEKLTFMQINV